MLTEVCFWVSRDGGDAADLLDMLNQGWLAIPFALLHESQAVETLLRMTELLPDSALLTRDGDFSIYRKYGKQPVDLIIPEERLCHRHIWLKVSGFQFDRQAVGSYEIRYNSTNGRYTVVSNHLGDMSEGTLRAIVRQADLHPNDFLRCK